MAEVTNSLSPAQIAALNRLAGYTVVSNNVPTPSPNGQGLYRQSVSPVPDTISTFDLQKQYADSVNSRISGNPRINGTTRVDAATQNAPTQSGNYYRREFNQAVESVKSVPQRVTNSPVVQNTQARIDGARAALNNSKAGTYVNNLSPRIEKFSARIDNGINRAASGVAIATSVIQLGSQLKNAVKSGDTANLISTGVNTAGTFLLAAPHPIAKGAGALLLIGNAIYDAFRSPQNQGGSTTQSPDFVGTDGVSYIIDYIGYGSISGAHPATITLTGRISAPFQIGSGWYIRSSSGADQNVVGGSSWYGLGDNTTSVVIANIRRADGTPEGITPPTGETGTDNETPIPNFDGWLPPDLDALQDRLNNLQRSSDDIKQLLAEALPVVNNGIDTRVQNLVPAPLPVPREDLGNAIQGLPRTMPPSTFINRDGSQSTTSPTPKNGYISAKKPFVRPQVPIPLVAPTPAPATTTTPQTTEDRFKQTDCKFSCENLAKCFVDLTVDIFDGCNQTNGTAKTKQITIQVLPKDKEKTEASFKELLGIRARECSLNDRVLTVPEYWQVRVGQRPQAVVLYREFLNGRFTDTYYSLSIPHYNGTKGAKPSLTQFSKGEHSAIYVCNDNSKIQVYAASESEAKRIVNEFEKLINPRMRGNIVHTGTRKGIKKTTVKPIRLDFYSTGQIKLSPDWSVAL